MGLTRIFLKLLFVFVLLTMNACQDSVPETTETSVEARLEAGSTLTNLIGRTTLKDGSKDNIIDKANCITIVLPITVIANSQEITINTEDDFQLIENVFEASSIDVDTLQIVFPITIIFEDFDRETIEDLAEFNDAVLECGTENELDEDIECIDFKYPLEFEFLAFGAAIPVTVTMTNDQELFEFVQELEEGDIANFNFPVTLIQLDGTEILVSSLELLEDTLEIAIDNCDEDDDYDFDDDDDTVLFDFLTSGNWIVDEYTFADQGFTGDYQGYIFDFENNGMDLSANNGVQIVVGNWSIDNTDPSNLLVILDFGTIAPFDVLNENWQITESEAGRLALQTGSEINGDLKVLVFEKL